jgi:hypothetical protein
MKCKMEMAVDIYTGVSTLCESGQLSGLRDEVERRLAGVRMDAGIEVKEGEHIAVCAALSDLWAFVALCSAGMRKGGENREQGGESQEVSGAGKRSAAVGPMLSGLLVGGGGQVVLQVAAKFDGMSAGLRATLCELDVGGLVVEVRLPGGSFRGCTSLRGVVWPVGLYAVGDSCFEGSGLDVVDWSGTRVRTAGKRAFSGCRRLSRIVWSRELDVVGASAVRVVVGGCARCSPWIWQEHPLPR